MRIIVPIVLAVFLATPTAPAQERWVAAEARDAEWEAHVCPEEPLRREVADEGRIVYWMSARYQGGLYVGSDPLPAGETLEDQVEDIVDTLRRRPETRAFLAIRPTRQGSSLAAEIVVDLGEIVRTARLWVADRRLFVAMLQVKPERRAEIEPHFKQLLRDLIVYPDLETAKAAAGIRERLAKDAGPDARAEGAARTAAARLRGSAPGDRDGARKGLRRVLAASPALAVDALADPDVLVRRVAIEALGFVADQRPARDALFLALADADPFLGRSAADALAAAGAPARDEALERIAGARLGAGALLLLAPAFDLPARRALLAAALEKGAPEDAALVLAHRARFAPEELPDPAVLERGLDAGLPVGRRMAALAGLEAVRAEGLGPRLLELDRELGDRPGTATRLLEALGHLGSPAELEALEAIAKEEDRRHRDLEGEAGDEGDPVAQARRRREAGRAGDRAREARRAAELIRFRETLRGLDRAGTNSRLRAAARDDELGPWAHRRLEENLPLVPPTRAPANPERISPERLVPHPPVLTFHLPDPAGAHRRIGELVQGLAIRNDVARLQWKSFLDHFASTFEDRAGVRFTDLEAFQDGSGLDLGRPVLYAEWLDRPSTFAGRHTAALLAGTLRDPDRFVSFLGRAARADNDPFDSARGILGAGMALPLGPAILALATMTAHENERRGDATPEAIEWTAGVSLDRIDLGPIPAWRLARTEIEDDGTIDTEEVWISILGHSLVLTESRRHHAEVLRRLEDDAPPQPAAVPPRHLDPGALLSFGVDVGAAGELAPAPIRTFLSPMLEEGTRLSGQLVLESGRIETRLRLRGELPRFVAEGDPAAVVAAVPEDALLWAGARFEPRILAERFAAAERRDRPWLALALPHLASELRSLTERLGDALTGEAGVYLPGGGSVERPETLVGVLGVRGRLARRLLEKDAWLRDRLDLEEVAPGQFRAGDDVHLAIVDAGDRSFLLLAGDRATLEAARSAPRSGTRPDAADLPAAALEVRAELRALERRLAVAAEEEEFFGMFAGVLSAFSDQRVRLIREGRGAVLVAGVRFDATEAYSVEALSAVASRSRNPYASAPLDLGALPRGLPSAFERLELEVRFRGDGFDPADVAGPLRTWTASGPREGRLAIERGPRLADRGLERPVRDPDLARWLGSTSTITADHPDVRDKAAEIVGDETNAFRAVRLILAWMDENLEYEITEESTARSTLEKRAADCSEYADLFVALCRAAGIPCRTVSGSAYGDGTLGGHAWAEVWLGEWTEVDPTWGLDHVPAAHIRSESGALRAFMSSGLASFEAVAIRNADGSEGRRLPLPPLTGLSAASRADGREILVVGPEPSGRLVGSTSADRGRTWSEPFPVALPEGNRLLVVAASGDEWIAIGHGVDGFGLLASTDGRQWEALAAIPRPGGLPETILFDAAAGASGLRLVFASTDPRAIVLVETFDRGRSFESIRLDPGSNWRVAPDGRLWRIRRRDDGRVAVSIEATEARPAVELETAPGSIIPLPAPPDRPAYALQHPAHPDRVQVARRNPDGSWPEPTELRLGDGAKGWIQPIAGDEDGFAFVVGRVESRGTYRAYWVRVPWPR